MTFTERCRNQETSHLDDNPLFCFCFFCNLFFFKANQTIKDMQHVNININRKDSGEHKQK